MCKNFDLKITKYKYNRESKGLKQKQDHKLQMAIKIPIDSEATKCTDIWLTTAFNENWKWNILSKEKKKAKNSTEIHHDWRNQQISLALRHFVQPFDYSLLRSKNNRVHAHMQNNFNRSQMQELQLSDCVCVPRYKHEPV